MPIAYCSCSSSCRLWSLFFFSCNTATVKASHWASHRWHAASDCDLWYAKEVLCLTQQRWHLLWHMSYNIYWSGSALKPIRQSFTFLSDTVVHLVLCLEGKELPLPHCLPKFSVAVLLPVSCLLLPAVKSLSSGSHTCHVITLAHSIGSFILHWGRGRTSMQPYSVLYVICLVCF